MTILAKPISYFCHSGNWQTSGVLNGGERHCPACQGKLWHCSKCGYNGTSSDNKCPRCSISFNEVDGKNLKVI